MAAIDILLLSMFSIKLGVWFVFTLIDRMEY